MDRKNITEIRNIIDMYYEDCYIDENTEKVIDYIINHVKTSQRENKIIIPGNIIKPLLTWTTLNYEIIVNVGVFDISYTNIAKYTVHKSDIVPNRIFASNFTINIFIPGRNEFSYYILKHDLIEELSLLYKIHNEICNEIQPNRLKHKSIDSLHKLNNCLIMLQNNDDQEISHFASVIKYILSDEQSYLLNSYYEELIKLYGYSCGIDKFNQTKYYNVIRKLHFILIRLNTDEIYYTKIEKYFKSILLKYFFNIRKELTDTEFKILFLERFSTIFNKLNKKADKIFLFVDKTFSKINTISFVSRPHCRISHHITI